MSERARALLINALVFPGMGQLLILRRRWVGGLLVACSLAAVLGLGWSLARQVLGVVHGLDVESLAVAPFEVLVALLEILQQPSLEVLCWGGSLTICWLSALVDAALFRPAVQVVTPEGIQ